VIASGKVNSGDLKDFYHSFHLNNFSYSEKSHLGAELDFKGDDDDTRKTRHRSTIDSLEISHEEVFDMKF
jgi:hypothetical protein